ncbi:hypothetical protein [Sphingomonas immobilis]|uniref:STAS/SEC14 domain-containing protein n=1 Tax=Sphingomonas immobilis TaxID=3063997 RepID=A0ABT8ZW31_9SPHN|nr:hypothetical protein [Sphingomonas sp. CA1-15]MDO7841784.1 hypothetical protein [Sphingomonas sp. CA1-15]
MEIRFVPRVHLNASFSAAISPSALVPTALKRVSDGVILYQIRLDTEAMLVRGEARDCWSLDETDRYIAALKSCVVASRAMFGRVRVLVDRRDVSIQSADVAARLAVANSAIFQADDRIALVVDSSLTKASLRQRMPHVGTKAFLSITAAETWLIA